MQSISGEITGTPVWCSLTGGVRKQKFDFISKMLKENILMTLILWSSSFVGATINI